MSTSTPLLERLVRGVERRARGRRLDSVRDGGEALHELLGALWPCPEHDQFEALWPSLLAGLHDQDLDVGRGAYGGWDDADPALAGAVWCLTHHLGPETVLETGVGRGLTTRVILQALEQQGRGRLWSIDLPPSGARGTGLAGQTGAAVPLELRGRWTLLQGASRDVLPGLIERFASADQRVGLFIHDSLHTGRNVRFELNCVWPALAGNGAAVIDDVEQNAAFAGFTRAHPALRSLVCDAADGRSQFGCLLRAGSE